MSKTKEKAKNKEHKVQKEFDRILEFLFSGQNQLDKIRIHQENIEKKCAMPKKKWFFAQ